MYRYISKYILPVKKRLVKEIEVGAVAYLIKGELNQSFRNYLKRDLVVLLCLPYGRILTFYEL